jgi:hypothetical protein
MTDVLTLGETVGAFRAAGPFRDLLDLQSGSTVR